MSFVLTYKGKNPGYETKKDANILLSVTFSGVN